MKSVRIFLAIISILFVVVIFIAVSAQLLIDPNRLKPLFIAEVKKLSGYNLVIDGKMRWSFYPFFSISIDKMTLAKPGQKQPMVTLENVSLGTPLGKLIFRNDDLSGYLDVRRVTFMGVHAQDASFRFLFSKHTLTLSPIYATFYGGTLHSHLYITGLYTAPRINGEVELNDFQTQSLLLDIKALDKLNLVGLGKITFDATTEGKTQSELLAHLDGTLNFTIQKGILFGVDLNYLINLAKSIIQRSPAPAQPDSPSTTFNTLQGLATIQSGVATLQNTILSTNNYKATTTGTIDLNQLQLNLKLQLAAINGEPNAPWIIPAIIKGPLMHPVVGLDMEEINKLMLKLGVEKAQEEINNHVPIEAQIMLQKLLNRSAL